MTHQAVLFRRIPDVGGRAPEWIKLIPAGAFTAIDGRGPFVNSDPQAVVRESLAKMATAGMVLDYDHATEYAAPHGRPAIAAGWIKTLEVRNGAIFARIEWTKAGAAAVQAKEYRYVSPVFDFDRPPGVPADATTGTVTRILRPALTNNPALISLPAIMSARGNQVTIRLTKTEKAICRNMNVSEARYIVQKIANAARDRGGVQRLDCGRAENLRGAERQRSALRRTKSARRGAAMKSFRGRARGGAMTPRAGAEGGLAACLPRHPGPKLSVDVPAGTSAQRLNKRACTRADPPRFRPQPPSSEWPNDPCLARGKFSLRRPPTADWSIEPRAKT